MSNGSSTLQYLRHLEVRDENLVLRRFMTGDRFRQIVSSQTLYFPTATKFEDELEGHPTEQDNRDRESKLRSWGLNDDGLATANQANKTVTDWNRQAVVISCWTRNDTDHERMWTDYAKIDGAVAIETTVGRLRQCLGDDFLIIPVRYVDFDRERIPPGHSLLPFFYKRASLFEWENEVRIIGEMVVGGRIGSPRIVSVDLGNLLQRVTISPTAPDQFAADITSIIENSIPNVPIKSSMINPLPSRRPKRGWRPRQDSNLRSTD